MARPALILFSDLDGTLLDHDTYDWSPAQPALDRLAQFSVPLVLASSKTRPEIDALRRQLSNPHPYIVENGAATVIPADYFGAGPEQVVCTGLRRGQVLERLQQLRSRGYRFTGFADMSAGQLAGLTGLSPEAAAMAGDRVATEPVLWQGTDEALAEFRMALSDYGLRLLAGGRFHHVMGDFDKADAMASLAARYRQHWPGVSWLSVALGDSPNDQAMLAGADLAVVIAGNNPDRIRLPPDQPVLRSQAPGPAGWNQCVLDILSRYGYH